jgi:hypothetical protein
MHSFSVSSRWRLHAWKTCSRVPRLPGGWNASHCDRGVCRKQPAGACGVTQLGIPSGDTSKPASRGHLKTGQLSASRTVIVLPHRWHFRQEFFKLNLPSAPNSVYTDLTWAEDRATQGCDPSADPAAGMAGRRQPPQKRTAILAENAVNPRGLGTASPTEESLLPIWFCSREIEWSHIHCGAPAAAVAAFVRQLRGPHLSTCP